MKKSKSILPVGFEYSAEARVLLQRRSKAAERAITRRIRQGGAAGINLQRVVEKVKKLTPRG